MTFRTEARLPAHHVLIFANDHISGESCATDLSGAGLKVAVDGPVSRGTVFWLHLCYRVACPALMTYYHSAVEIDQAVARWSTAHAMGLQITRISQDNERRLKRLLTNVQVGNGR